MKFTPGPGLGGHCIPIDPYYLSWKLKTLDYDARFIKLAGEINTQMPKHVVDLISSSLNKYQKSINGSKILIFGVAYKKDIDDYRESPAIDIIEILKKEGSEVHYFDPYIPCLSFNKIMMKGLDEINPELIKDFDACVILANHSNIDYNLIDENASLIIDTRNVFGNKQGKHLIRLGQG